MKRGRPQAKDIPDALVLAIVKSISAQRRAADPHGPPNPWTFTWDIEENIPCRPGKVVLAKLRALIRRKLLTGCGCGCRGDFSLTEAGAEALATAGLKVRARPKYPIERIDPP